MVAIIYGIYGIIEILIITIISYIFLVFLTIFNFIFDILSCTLIKLKWDRTKI